MSGGKIQGDQPPRTHRSTEEVMQKAKTEIQRDLRKASQAQTTDQGVGMTSESTGLPAPDHERPNNEPGERDPMGVARGRKGD